MNIKHLDAFAKEKGFESVEDFLKDQYAMKGVSLEAIAFDLEISPKSVKNLLDTFHIFKREKKIPLTLRDAKRLGPDSIAKAHGISRSTAWRWKQAILKQGLDDEEL